MPYQNYPSRLFGDLRKMLRASVKQFGDKTLFLQKKEGVYRKISYKRYYEDVCALGTELLARGLGGKRILVIGENSYPWVTAYMAVICGVGVVVPVDRELSSERISDLAHRCDAAAVIHSASVAKKLTGLDDSIVRIGFGELGRLAGCGQERMARGDRSYLDAVIDPAALSALIFTSGTTGDTKGVMLSHRNLCFNLYQMCKMIYIGSDDIFLSVLPLHHCYETTCGFLCPLYRGVSVAFADGLRRLMQDMQAVRPTVMLCVPMLPETIHQKIYEGIRRYGMEAEVQSAIRMTNALYPASVRMSTKKKVFSAMHQSFGGRLRLLISGGAPLDPSVTAGLRDFGFQVLQGYGLTECAPIAALNRDTFSNDASVGMATPDTLLDVCDIQDDGIGEIRFRGENVMLGYYGMPDETSRVLRDGWFYTGDLGYLDEKGFLFIVGRKKNMIVTADGKNIFPEELEGLLDHSRFVKESLVVGKKNDKAQTVELVAVLHPDYEALRERYGESFTDSQLDLEMNRAVTGTNAQLPPYKRIDSFSVSPTPFPKNTSRKIIREAVVL
ncbi:MAG: AMP-binding protein [Clostridia bacterium]|nr:AMP-binding protein [Clostridia bacterium]